MKFSDFLTEETSSGDIATFTPKLGQQQKQKQQRKRICPECGAEINDTLDINISESPVGCRGRTGINDALEHITPELRKEFKDIIKKLGGLTITRTLLNQINDLEPEPRNPQE